MAEDRKIPEHIAVIMDGNGRWAQKRGLARSEGHIKGVESVYNVINVALDEGVKYLTLYMFSTENWGRPEEEISMIMELFCQTVVDRADELQQEGVRVEMIGDFDALSEKVREYKDIIVEATKNNDKLTLIIAINYSSRNEITAATRKIAERVANGELMTTEITETTIDKALYTHSYPDPDLVIRTSGEYRLSNFLLWQCAYSELHFTDTLWPDFSKEEFTEIIKSYGLRDRRFGLVKNNK